MPSVEYSYWTFKNYIYLPSSKYLHEFGKGQNVNLNVNAYCIFNSSDPLNHVRNFKSKF